MVQPCVSEGARRCGTPAPRNRGDDVGGRDRAGAARRAGLDERAPGSSHLRVAAATERTDHVASPASKASAQRSAQDKKGGPAIRRGTTLARSDNEDVALRS